MKTLKFLIIIFVLILSLSYLYSADIQIHGDFNNRFTIYNNHVDLFNWKDPKFDSKSVPDSWGEAKYRFWWDVATNNGKVKGVWACEVGSLKYGKSGSVGKHVGGGFSGDGVNIETRWLYTDFKLPWNDKIGIKMGLFGLSLNKFYWKETQMGVQIYGNLKGIKYIFGWSRPDEHRSINSDDDETSLDSFYLKLNFSPINNFKLSIFGDYIYKNADPDNYKGENKSGYDNNTGYYIIKVKNRQWYEVKPMAKSDFSIFTFGLSGKYKYNKIFVNFHGMWQTGSIDKIIFNINDYDYKRIGNNHHDFDLNSYFLHLDLGYKFAVWKLTYTFWYASGDDDPYDDDFNAFISVDVDEKSGKTLLKGMSTEDDFFVETPYVADKGFIMNKLALDWKVNKKLTVGTAAIYMMLAEDIEYLDNYGKKQRSDKLGFEGNAYLKYMLYNNLEFYIDAAFLLTDDAMDYWEVDRDGDADENIFLTTAKVRYRF